MGVRSPLHREWNIDSPLGIVASTAHMLCRVLWAVITLPCRVTMGMFRLGMYALVAHCIYLALTSPHLVPGAIGAVAAGARDAWFYLVTPAHS